MKKFLKFILAATIAFGATGFGVQASHADRWHHRRHYHHHHHSGGDVGAAIAGGIIGGAIIGAMTAPAYRAPAAPAYNYGDAHVRWCYNRYRSYRAYDNTFQPYEGPRQQCYSPYD